MNRRIEHERQKLLELIKKYNKKNLPVYCLGASTKGNTLLQYYGLNNKHIKAIGEINKDKFGKFTPGSKIQIVNEDQILIEENKNALFIVLPWHFKDSILRREKDYIEQGGKFIFPLPEIEIV